MQAPSPHHKTHKNRLVTRDNSHDGGRMITFANLKIFCSRLLKHFHESKLISSRLLTEEFFSRSRWDQVSSLCMGTSAITNLVPFQEFAILGAAAIPMNSSLAAVSWTEFCLELLQFFLTNHFSVRTNCCTVSLTYSDLIVILMLILDLFAWIYVNHPPHSTNKRMNKC